MTFNHEDYGYFHGNATPQWVDEVNNALKNDDVNIAVDLGGVLGPETSNYSAPLELFAEAYRRGVANGWEGGPGTQWKMSRVGYHAYVGNQDWNKIEWYMHGVPLGKLPELDWAAPRKSAGQ
ncbi:polymorphic toxin type 27 domain-containing protein [Streptomyces sp. NPDC006393]|uniref:polymorphic toxin type 27 domain-containing protein n=1 Tax=Streptomyces sp. NPDC006393 TaxID=3156763 RepID=UPI0033D66427